MKPLEILLEILKLTIPGLVVFATVYVLLKQMTHQLRLTSRAELKKETQKTTIHLRLQAYERLSLYCERISIPNLIFRLKTPTMTANSLNWAMKQAIQQEFEHNITQQIYVSDTLWQILKLAKENIIQSIDQVLSEQGNDEDCKRYIENLIHYLNTNEKDPLATALQAIKKEAAIVI